MFMAHNNTMGYLCSGYVDYTLSRIIVLIKVLDCTLVINLS